jgi:signal transduction histidine kinase
MADATIFIIDDEPGIVSLCTRFLTRAGYEVQGVSDPAAGLETLNTLQFDLLLVDIRMPGLDGFKVIESTRKYQPEIAVVIMTGFGTLETAIRALRQGADGLILKPFENGDDLVKTVADALKVRREKQEVSRLRAIRPLLSLTESLFSETRTEVLLDLILKAILSQLNAEHAMIYQRAAGDSFLSLMDGAGRLIPEEHARAGGGILARADHWDVPIWVNREGPGESGVGDRSSDGDFRPLLEEKEFSSLICLPIKRGGGSLVFVAARDAGRPGFHLADVEAFGLMARQADIALENSRLYEELRAYVRQVEQSQRALIQAEKMSAVGRLTASIAHEVNNPLQAVQNCLHLGQRKELSAEQRKEYLQMAEEEMDRLMGTVQRMLDFYRPGALKRTTVEITNLIERVLALLEKQLEDQKIAVTKTYPKDLPLVTVVANQIQQVFFNLLLNAMDALGQGGTIEITVSVTKNKVVVDIRDSGPGVDPAVRETIFEPFVSSSDDGTGLGLSVSYGILTAHNGTLELVEDDRPGACFRVTIPWEGAI